MAKILRDEDWLQGHLPATIDPIEERYFADLLAVMNAREMTILKAAVERNISTGSMKELINLANSVGDWPVAGGVHNDAQLGRFLYDNQMLPTEEHDAATMKLNVTYYPDDYLNQIGRKHREAEGGFYTSLGYVENQGITDTPIPENYKPTNNINGEEIPLESASVSGPISAFITNLGKYNEGQLVGEWHSFPTTPEQIQETFKRIGIDGVRYEEFFITDYETSIDGIYDTLPEYANLDELNYLASQLENMTNREIEIYEAALDIGDCSSSVQDLINLTENLDCYDYMEGITDDRDLGYYYVEDSGIYDTKAMGSLSNYIDHERFGQDIRFDEGGVFSTNGYIRSTGDSFDEIYNGVDIPDEHRLFSTPDEPEYEHEGSITVLLVEPGKEPRETEIDNTLAAMQQMVGGMIQAVYPYEEPVAIICNDEGKMEGLPLNRALYDEDGKMYDIVAGNFFICGLGEDGDFASLSPDLIEKFDEQFRHPEDFVKLAGQIVAVKQPLPKQKDGPEQTADKPKSHDPEL